MDAAGKFVLKTQKVKLKETLYLSDKIMDKLEESDTIDEEIAQKVKCEKTNEERIDKLLYYIKRRGPDAFHNFIAAIKTDPVYEMLTRDLEAEYYKALRDNGKELCTTEKRAMQKDINSNHIPLDLPTSDSLSGLDTITELRVQDSLCTLYTSLKAHMTNANLRELSFASPKPVTFKMVKDLQDKLMETVDACYDVLGVKDKTKSLQSHIIDLKAKEKMQRYEVQEKEKQRNNLSHQYMKLENKNRELKSENSRFRKEKDILKEKSQELEGKLDKLIAEKTSLNDKISELNEELSKFTKRQTCDVCTQTTQQNSSGYKFSSPPSEPSYKRNYGQRVTVGLRLIDKQRSHRQLEDIAESSPRPPTVTVENHQTIEKEVKVNPKVKFDQNNKPEIAVEKHGNFEEEVKFNPHVKFDQNIKPVTTKTSSKKPPPLSGLCIGNIVNKDTKHNDLNAEKSPRQTYNYSKLRWKKKERK